MGSTYRRFTPEFKDETVKLVINTCRLFAVLAHEIGLQEQTLGRWVKLFKGRQDNGEQARGVGASRKDNAELMLDRVFLKKRHSSSPRKPRIRTPSIRTDARGEEYLFDYPQGPAVGDVEVWSLRLVSARTFQQSTSPERIEQKVARFHGESDEVTSKNSVAKTMRTLGLNGVYPKRWKTTTITDTTDAYSVDGVKRTWVSARSTRFGSATLPTYAPGRGGFT